MSDLITLPAIEMSRLIGEKEISPVELLEAHLQQIESRDPALNAFVCVDGENARKAAREAESAVLGGKKTGRLHGVPMTVKSSIDCSGLLCETGSRLMAGKKAGGDAPLVARLRAAGAVIVGNTNVPEMLMAWETDNALHGRTNNPWDLGRTPGGSSGGEAAAIAACCSAGGIGSDGGGSIRVPAHFCGICGLKPTPGRVPSTGHFPVSAGPFAWLGVVGPMARNIADVRAIFEVVAGYDAGDPVAAPVAARNWSDQEMRKTRIGVFEDDGHSPVTEETRQAVRSAAKALEARGFSVESFRPEYLDRMRELWWNIFVRISDELFAPMLAGRESELSSTFSEFRKLQSEQPPLTKKEVLQTWFGRDEVRARLLEDMKKFPILLSPVCSIPAYRHGERRWTIAGQNVEYLDAMSYSQWVNLTGSPAAVVPVRLSPEGLPIAVQVIGRPYEDELVLAVSQVIEDEVRGARLYRIPGSPRSARA